MPRRRSLSFNPRDAQAAGQLFAQLPRRLQITLIILAIVAGLIFLLVKYRQQHPTAGTSADTSAVIGDLSDTLDENLFLGNPSDATTGLFNTHNYLLDKKYYALSYDNEAGEAKWVSWRLTKADLGSTPRKPEFDPDESLPIAFKHIVSHDYVGSGFDRGHLCPHGDRASFSAQSDSTFCMTNIVPQSHLINEGVWGDEENYLRRLVRDGHRLYIVAGPAGKGGSGAGGARTTIAGGKVVVPASTWKIAVVADENGGPDNFAAITPRTRVIAVIMPNDSRSAGGSWMRYRTRTADIERQTGLHFSAGYRRRRARRWRRSSIKSRETHRICPHTRV